MIEQWVKDDWVCELCKSKVIVSIHGNKKDYKAFCSNENCENSNGEDIYDDDEPIFIIKPKSE